MDRDVWAWYLIIGLIGVVCIAGAIFFIAIF